MTQEEKARAYDEALKKVKDMLSYKEVRHEDMEYIFPELKESEDEKIRKEIFHFVLENTLSTDMRQHRWLAWLEKQGEQKPKWSEEDEKCIDNCCLLIGAADNCYEKTFKDDCIHYLQNLKERMGV